MKKYKHYERYEWLGNFRTPDDSLDFSGRLTYSPEDGIQLEFFYPMRGVKIARADYIYGRLSTGEICTLYGSFNPDSFGFHSGEISIYKSKIKFLALLFGENAADSKKYDGIWSDFTNFQEFCYPQGYKDFVKYSSSPIQETQTSELKINIVNSAKFKLIQGGDINNLLHCENEEVSAEIGKFFMDLKSRFADEDILARSDIGWTLELLSNKGMTVREVLDKIYSFENLMSLLVYSPVRREQISIMRQSEIVSGKFDSLSLLTSIFDMDRSKVEFLNMKLSHMMLPITAKNSKITEIYARWLEAENGFELFTATIANDFGKVHRHELYAEIVLTLTQLESISYSLGGKANEKYTRAFNKYGCAELMSSIMQYFSISDDEKLGKCLTDLRAEIAHVGKPVKHLKNISFPELYGIAKCIGIVIASHIYQKLGIGKREIEKFQMQQCRDLPT